MNMEMLLDNWEISGTDRNKMFETLQDISAATHVCPCRTNQLQLFTVREVTEQGILGYNHNAAGSKQKTLTPAEMLKDGITGKLAEELGTQSHLLFHLGDAAFPSTKKVLKTLCQRAGSGMGDFALRDELNVRFYRDAGYVAYMCTVPAECQVLFRQAGKAKKIYAVFAGRYRIIPQYDLVKALISDFEKEMGTADITSWRANNFFTEIFVEFPDKARDFSNVYQLKDEVIPGIRVYLSDTGESSFVINGSIRIGRSVTYVPGADYSRAHTKKATVESIADAVGKEIFQEYTKVPERLVELLAVDVKNPALLIPKISAYCGIKKEFGATFENSLLQEAEDAITPGVDYTAYDLATLFIDVCADSEGDKSTVTVTKLRSCAAKALFYKYD